MQNPNELIKSILDERYEDDFSKVAEVRAGLEKLLKALDRIEAGDDDIAMRFGYMLDDFIKSSPAMKVQEHLWNRR